MFRPTLYSMRTCLAPASLAALWAALVAAPAPAADQEINADGFTLKISEKEMKLEHPTDMMWDKYLMWDLPFQRVNNRNMPYLELTNDPKSTAPITEFHLTIGDDRFNFSKAAQAVYALLGSTTPNVPVTSGVLDNGDELVVNFGDGGLQPGEFVRFKIDINIDPAFTNQFFNLPDYRTVLFDMNGVNVYDGNLHDTNTSDNAMASAIFKPAAGATFTVGPIPFADETVVDGSALYFNEHRRHYRDSGTDLVNTFQLVGEPVTVPEPDCAILAAISVVGGLLSARRSTRAARFA